MRNLSVILAILTINFHCNAQTYLGFTADIGNTVSSTPDAGYLLKQTLAPSGSLIILKQEQIRNDWVVQYGGSAGTLGCMIRNKDGVDTLSTGYDPRLYTLHGHYSTIYVDGQLSFGKRINVKKRKIGFFLGGGVTYYFSSDEGSSVGVCDGISRCETVFEFELGRKDDKIKGFAETSVQTNLTKWLLFGLRYRLHFSPALEGTYNFYHTDQARSGKLEVTQRALGIFFLIKLSKKYYEAPEPDL